MRAIVLPIAAAAIACSNAGPAGNQAQPAATAGPLPADAAILDGRAVPALLRQCSRGAPAAGETSWLPAPADVAALEAALPAALAAHGRPEVAGAPQGWRRQYVGIERAGRRFIYGNFIPVDPDLDRMRPERERWRGEPLIVCDGGPAFFGVEYEVAARRFTHVAFNGGP